MVDLDELHDLGFGRHAIASAIDSARLHRTQYRTVYATVRTLSRKGGWYEATRACRPTAGLSHGSGAALLELGVERLGMIEVSVLGTTSRIQPGVRVYRRSSNLRDLFVVRDSIRVTDPALTIVDLARRLSDRGIDRAINEAVGRGLASVQAIRDTAASIPRVRGAARVRDLLDRRTFHMTRSELERQFIPLLAKAGLPEPRTFIIVNGFEVDFWIAELNLVIETDSWGWHRTPAQLARDTERDHAHLAAGCTPVRFSHEQIYYDSAYVINVLRDVVEQIKAGRRLRLSA